MSDLKEIKDYMLDELRTDDNLRNEIIMMLQTYKSISRHQTLKDMLVKIQSLLDDIRGIK